MTSIDFKENKYRLNLENQVDETIQNLNKFAIAQDSNKLLDKCFELRNALQNLLNSYDGNTTNNNNNINKNTEDGINKNVLIRKTNSIRRLVK